MGWGAHLVVRNTVVGQARPSAKDFPSDHAHAAEEKEPKEEADTGQHQKREKERL